MTPDHMTTYDAARQLERKGVRAACYAPYVSMFFDPRGHVTACCQNTSFVLGSVAEQTLSEIWHGRQAEILRGSLRGDTFGPGCEFCRWQVEDGNVDPFAVLFDRFPVDDPSPRWPSQMEFALSNTCNLECVMCHGEFSSMIRAHRERLPPLPPAYGDEFFEQLRPFLPHLLRARFFGGEPFLARESFRVWDLMIADNLAILCHVTTNGTVWNDKVERVLTHLPVSIGISMDGVTPETVEHIRVRASFDRIMDNLARFQEYTSERGTQLSLTFCLMRANWHEFAEYLRFADERGLEVFVNTVMYPPSLSLYRLPASDLREVITALDNSGRGLELESPHNQRVWHDELGRLRHWLARIELRGLPAAEDRAYFEAHVEQVPVTLSPASLSEVNRSRQADPAEGLGVRSSARPASPR